MEKTTFLLFSPFILVLFTGACGDKADPIPAPTGPGNNGSTVTVTYTQDIKPILDSNCITCHASNKSGSARNGAPPNVNFDTHEAAVASAQRANLRIQAGTMPPGGGISNHDRSLFQNWIDAGTPE